MSSYAKYLSSTLFSTLLNTLGKTCQLAVNSVFFPVETRSNPVGLWISLKRASNLGTSLLAASFIATALLRAVLWRRRIRRSNFLFRSPMAFAFRKPLATPWRTTAFA